MRTRIKITDGQGAELLKMAGSRGEKGFSGVVEEGLEAYLAARQQDSQKVTAALTAGGSLSDQDGRELAEKCDQIRRMWR